MRGYLLHTGLAMTLLFNWSCSKKDDPWEDLPPYNGEWLLPLVQGDAALIQLSQLQRIPLTAEVNSSDLGIPPGTYPFVPGVDLPLVGPFPIPVADFLEVMEVRSMEVTLRLENPFPIPISSGTRVVLRNEADPFDPGNIVLDIPISPELGSGGVFEYSGTITNVEITDTLHLYLEDFSSPGGSNVTFDGTASTVDITLASVEVDRMEIDTDVEFQRTDTLSLEIDTELQDQTDAATGEVIVYADNGLPVSASFQCYLYDASGVLLDSLFDAPFAIAGGATDAAGVTTQTVTSSDTIPVDPVTLDRFLRSEKVVLSYGVSTAGYPGATVAANAVAALRLQLVGDLRLNISYSDLE